MHEWIETIKANPHIFPRLSILVEMREGSEKPFREQVKNYTKNIWPEALTLLAALYGIRRYYAYKRRQAQKGRQAVKQAEPPMTRRQFFGRAAVGTGALVGSRATDISTTRSLMLELQNKLVAMQALPEFQRLPVEVQNNILPPLDAVEGNVLMKGLAKQYLDRPWRVATDALAGGAGISAAIHGVWAYKKRPRRALPYSLALAGIFLFISSKAMRFKGQMTRVFQTRDIQTELQNLHAVHKKT